ncbi:hypothetical protein O3P69_015267 [Scylla paramamosain]|uniref:Uncharacterized protein n=1 Tax=Scylla paramamosain TaxID=85552 RepID=A0AAW0T603_SCYPA
MPFPSPASVKEVPDPRPPGSQRQMGRLPHPCRMPIDSRSKDPLQGSQAISLWMVLHMVYELMPSLLVPSSDMAPGW